MNINALNTLADAISDAGAWYWWHVYGDMVQMEFRDIQLYDDSKPEKDTHTTDVLAVRFHNNAFAVFLDNLADERWHERFHDEDAVIYPVDAYELAFDDVEAAKSLLNDYKNRVDVKGFSGPETLESAAHLLSGRCGEVGFVVGGEEIAVVGRKGRYTEEEILSASAKWWEYWKRYWELRNTKEAYPKDFACEVSIPAGKESLKGADPQS